MTHESDIALVYDKECPFCDFYCQMVRIQSELGEIKIVDARESSDLMCEITRKGWDIDQGMVLRVGESYFYGSDAIHALALLSNRSGFFNRLNYWVFRSRWLAHILYPVLRALRNFALKLMGKTKINNLNVPGNDQF